MADLTEAPAAVVRVHAPPATVILQFLVLHVQMPTASRRMFSWKKEEMEDKFIVQKGPM
jgi:hypothetical protein